MRIIPAIDIIGGSAVRLEKGDFLKKTIYNSDPVEVAKSFEDAGIKHLHLVDLDGAKEGKVVNLAILENIKTATSLIVDFGGGIRNVEDIHSLRNAGADQVNIGSLSVKNKKLTEAIINEFGSDYIILSPDVIDMKVAVHGWQEESKIHILDYLEDYKKKGIDYFVCTDIAKDGMLTGSSVDLYKQILSKQSDIKLIASGGVAEFEELIKLKEIGVEGVIIGKAIYEGRISLKQLQEYVI